MPLEVLESVDSEQPLIIPVFDFMYTVTLVLILFAFAHLFSPWHSSSKLDSAHLAYRKRSLSRTFSRHGIAQASLTLLIWLIENVRFRAPFLAMAKLKQACLCSFGLTKTFKSLKYVQTRHRERTARRG